MTGDPRALIDAIAGRADAATPPQWDAINGNDDTGYFPLWVVTNDEFHNPTCDDDAPWIAVEIHVGTREDAEFIAAARSDVPRLVAALRAVLDEMDRCQSDRDRAAASPWSSVKHMPAIAEVNAVRRVITDALAGQ